MNLLLITALAVFCVWELLLVITPVRPAPWLQPVLVAGCAVGAGYVPDRILFACAVAGAVAVLHRLVADTPVVTPRRRGRGVPRL